MKERIKKLILDYEKTIEEAESRLSKTHVERTKHHDRLLARGDDPLNDSDFKELSTATQLEKIQLLTLQQAKADIEGLLEYCD